MTVFWDVTQCSLVEVDRADRRFRGTYCLYHEDEAVNTSETSLDFYETTRRSIPEESLHTCRRKNLNSRKV
jgi:hypothetical protein